MGDTEGCQRFIYSTIIKSTQISTNGYLPQDYFKLRINSNDAYLRLAQPSNNCYNFVIKSPPSSAESIQFRIAQCNCYQVVNLKVPVRNSRGIGLPPLRCTRKEKCSVNFKSQFHHDFTCEWTKSSVNNPTKPIHPR